MAGECDTEGNIDDGFEIFMVLVNALRAGNWKAAEEFLACHPHAVWAKITATGKTALRVAAEAGRLHMVEELVNYMTAENLEMRHIYGSGFTALAWATSFGNYRIVKCMLDKNTNLSSIEDDSGNIPVVLALKNGHLELARYLFLRTPSQILMQENGRTGATVVCEAIYNNALGKN